MTVCAIDAPPVSETTERNPANTKSRYRTSYWCGVAVLSITAVLGRLGYLFEPFGGDSAYFIYMGKVVAAGGRAGIEVIDNKFPTVGLMTSGTWRLFGACWPAYVILQAAMIIGAILLLARAVGRYLGPHTLVPTALFAIVYFNFSIALGGGFQLESMQAFFAIIAAAAALAALFDDDARDAFVVGLAGAMALMFKPSAIAVLLAFSLACLVQQRRSPLRLAAHATCMLAGIAIPAAAALVYFFNADLLPALPGISRQIASYAANSHLEWFDIGKWVVACTILGFPLLIRGMIFRRPNDRAVAIVSGPLRIFAITWLLLEAAGVVAQRRMYPYHFFVLAPPAALLFGMLPRRDRFFPLLAALGLPLLLSIYGSLRFFECYNAPRPRQSLIQYFATHAAPDATVWQDNLQFLLVQTELKPGSRNLATFLWANDDESPQYFSRMLLSDFADRRPRYIVLPTKFDQYLTDVCDHIRELEMNPHRRANYLRAWGEVRAYILANYYPETQLGSETIFRRTPAAAPASTEASQARTE